MIPWLGLELSDSHTDVGVVLGVQDLAQLELVRRDRLVQILWSQPRAKILFPPADDRLAERISKMLGSWEGAGGAGYQRQSIKQIGRSYDLRFIPST